MTVDPPSEASTVFAQIYENFSYKGASLVGASADNTVGTVYLTIEYDRSSFDHALVRKLREDTRVKNVTSKKLEAVS